MHTGTYQQGHDKVQERVGYLPRAYNQLFKADQSAQSRPEVTVVSEKAFDGDLYLDPWSENTTNMKGAHSTPQGEKVVAEGCSGARGGGRGGSLVLRRLLVQPDAPLFRFPSQCQGPGIDR